MQFEFVENERPVTLNDLKNTFQELMIKKNELENLQKRRENSGRKKPTTKTKS